MQAYDASRRQFSRARGWMAAIASLVAGAVLVVPVAAAHDIRLHEAQRVVKPMASSFAGEAAAGFNELRGSNVRIDVSVLCRRASAHVARCSWRALVYSDYGDLSEMDVAMVCWGGARVSLSGPRLRAQRMSASCVRSGFYDEPPDSIAKEGRA